MIAFLIFVVFFILIYSYMFILTCVVVYKKNNCTIAKQQNDSINLRTWNGSLSDFCI